MALGILPGTRHASAQTTPLLKRFLRVIKVTCVTILYVIVISSGAGSQMPASVRGGLKMPFAGVV